MKILLITDQHFGVRNDNQSFIDHYRRFYGEIVLPFIDAHEINTVIALGDTFDKRRSINFMSLEAAKDMWFNPLAERNVQMHMLVGNHDIYYKNTLRVNAPSELLDGYRNISVHTEPTTRIFDNLSILLLPWICDENYERTLEVVAESTAPVCMGHPIRKRHAACRKSQDESLCALHACRTKTDHHAHVDVTWTCAQPPSALSRHTIRMTDADLRS